VLGGGEGGAKSHFFAEQIVLRCFQKKTRVACIREVQASIRDSVRQLIVDKITKLGLNFNFEILESEIRGIKGTSSEGSLIVFKGMQSYNANNIKSLEDFDIAWVEEAQTFSEVSLRMLRPTIRKDGSEIWFSWNPRHEDDPVDKFFRSGNSRDGMVSVGVNWSDNPWFPEVLRKEMEDDYRIDAGMADHVWGGGYELITEASYYGRYIAAAEREGRVGHYPHNPDLPVMTSWDIGVDDYTAIWFWQTDGEIVWAVDYYEVSGDGAEQIVAVALPELRPKGYVMPLGAEPLGRDEPFKYQRHYLPHDVKNREWGSGAKSRVQILQGLGVRPINEGIAANPEDRVAALRALFPILHFHDCARVKLGLQRLRRYSRKHNERMGVYTGVEHDINSHAADGAGEFAINCSIRPPVKEEKKKRPFEDYYDSDESKSESWMTL